MCMRSLARGLFVLLVAGFVAMAAASCGSDATIFDGGLPDGSTDGTLSGDVIGFTNDGSGGCTAKTCADLGYTCGMNGDGCGGILDCGTCTSPEYCGGGGYSKCGGYNGQQPDGAPINTCTPGTCLSLGYDCGQTGDGCGGILSCGSCTNPQFCGGGGFNKCGGNNGLSPDGGTACTPATCQSLNYDCGQTGDGCGGILNCGSSCTNPQFCGGGGFNKCGGNNGLTQDGGVPCTPTTCGQLGYNCGFAADGCGGTLNCGSCTNPQFCGGGGFDVCGGNNGLTPDGSVSCTPTTCGQLGYNCGFAADGCGGTLNCGSCNNPQFCGGGGFDICGGNNGLTPDGGVACTPTTCAQLGYNCGFAGDGCGGLLNCGGCNSPQYCGGGGFDVCGPTNISTCDGGTSTSLSGYVFDPANNLPVYNALVYVPVGNVQTPQTGILPAQCGCTAPAAYASAYTGINGAFTITNLPSGANVTVVVQLGKWQRVFTKSVTACQANNLGGGTAGSPGNLTLPSTKAQGHIPLFAVDTGSVDTMECVLLKMGIAQSEFTDPNVVNGVPTGSGRIQLYEGSIVSGGAVIDGNTPTENVLTESSSVMDSYDAILFPCQGGAGSYTSANGWPNTRGNLISYANNGGRFFATHFHYDLLEGNGSFNGTANWVADSNYLNSATGYIDTSFNRGLILAQWLNQPIVYGGTYGQIPVNVVRKDLSSVIAPAQRWMYQSSTYPIHYTFDTPFNQTPSCGRVVFSDFHVEASNGSTGVTFPNECTTGGMTPQEKLLEFMLFDLTSCVGTPTCTPLTCAQQNITCGPAGDGCGGQLNCGTCNSPQTSGGGGQPGQCGYPDAGTCTPKTCPQQNISCGPAGDGCGGQLSCGTCNSPQTCGGGGPNQCGYPDGGSCTPLTCPQQNINCGPAGDGCGNLLQCGTCTPPQTCGGGGTPGQCGTPGSCTPTTCPAQNISCGPAGDGCGGLLQCGTCTPPQTCGGGGTPGQCGGGEAGTCTPLTCAQQNFSCGPAGDGCGGLLQCGTCTPPQTCGGGGVAGQCGGVL